METDLLAIWQRYDARLEALERDPFAARDAALDRVRTSLGRLAFTVRLELIMNAIAVVLLGGFAADHVGRPDVFAAAVVLDVCAIAFLAAGIAQLALVMRVDYVSPVLPIATTLGNLRLLRGRTTFITLAIAPLLWVPLLIVGMQALFGIDAVTALGAGALLINFAFGAAFLVVAMVVARRFGSRSDRPELIQQVMDALSGHDVRDAAAYIEQLVTD